MQWLAGFLVMVVVGGSIGDTKSPGQAGISQFWTDDYKVFDQIYGKTSDKDIYGATLPPTISYGLDATKLQNAASEKKERYFNHQIPEQADESYQQLDFGNKYTELLKKQALKNTKLNKPKPQLNFIGTDFKPISQNNDPETYNYLKHLEQLQRLKEAPELNVGGFKPYVNYAGSNPEDTDDAYKSIQDILDAHEANKGKVKDNQDTDLQVKYLTYGNAKAPRSQKPKPRAPAIPPKTKPRCTYGRCRKRATNAYRVLTRPYVRKIKKIYY